MVKQKIETYNSGRKPELVIDSLECAGQNDWEAYQELLLRGGESGYVGYWQDIDAEIAQSTKCPKCNKLMKYQGFGREEGRKTKYTHAIAYCAGCQWAYSF